MGSLLVCLLFSGSASRRHLPERVWRTQAAEHLSSMLGLLYPCLGPEASLKERVHAVARHPVYNFLHVYYRYAVSDLLCFSPGPGVTLEGVGPADLRERSPAGRELAFRRPLLLTKFLSLEDGRASYSLDRMTVHQAKAFDIAAMLSSRETLEKTARKTAFFGCFGLHEWAMLYSGGPGGRLPERHQATLPLRVSQATIDRVVEEGVRCTHFDAFRFFHPAARRFNLVDPITKQRQSELEQPGCVHANMVLSSPPPHRPHPSRTSSSTPTSCTRSWTASCSETVSGWPSPPARSTCGRVPTTCRGCRGVARRLPWRPPREGSSTWRSRSGWRRRRSLCEGDLSSPTSWP